MTIDMDMDQNSDFFKEKLSIERPYSRRQGEIIFPFPFDATGLKQFLSKYGTAYHLEETEKSKEVIFEKFIQSDLITSLKKLDRTKLFQIMEVDQNPDENSFNAHIHPLLDKLLESEKWKGSDRNSQSSTKLFFSLACLCQAVRDKKEDYWDLGLLQIVNDHFDYFSAPSEQLL